MMSIGAVIVCPIPTFSSPKKHEEKSSYFAVLSFTIDGKSTSSVIYNKGVVLIRHRERRSKMLKKV